MSMLVGQVFCLLYVCLCVYMCLFYIEGVRMHLHGYLVHMWCVCWTLNMYTCACGCTKCEGGEVCCIMT